MNSASPHWLSCATEHLELRRAVSADFEPWSRMYACPITMEFLRGPNPKSPVTLNDDLLTLRGQEREPLAISYGEKFIGYAAAFRRNRQGPFDVSCIPPQFLEVVLTIAKEYWGYRFGAEVLEALERKILERHGAVSLVGDINPMNQKCIGLFSKRGFREVGRIAEGHRDAGHLLFMKTAGLDA